MVTMQRTLRSMVHPLLAAAHDIIDPHRAKWNPDAHSLITMEPPHLGGAQPVVPRRMQAELVFWCADTLAPLLPSAQRARLVTLLTEVRSEGFARAKADKQAEIVAALRSQDPSRGVVSSAEASPLRIAGFVADAASPRLGGRNTPRSAWRAVAFTTQTLSRNRDKGVLAPEEFVDALDVKLLRAEWVAYADRTRTSRRSYDNAGARLEALVYRAADDTRENVVWVAKLKPGTEARSGPWAVLVRRRGFHFAEGSPGDALAIVPDEYFESAAAVLFARANA